MNDDRTIDLTYRLHAGNEGNVQILNLQITDDLAQTFDGFEFDVTSITSSDFEVNPNFNGTSDTNLLGGTDTLDIAATGSVDFTVTVDTSDLNESEVTFENIAFATGTSPIGEPVRTPTSPGSVPVDPAENGNGDGTPTTVTVDLPGMSDSPPALAFTGQESRDRAAYASLLLAVGLLFVAVGRRRKPTEL